MQLVEYHPGSLGSFCRQFSAHVTALCGSGRRVRDLLPLPLPDVTAARRWSDSKMKGCAPRSRPVARQAMEEAWLFVVVVGLNYLYCGRCKEAWRHHPRLSLAQERPLAFLRER
eukprot:1780950-Pyramimonas_sp.AAC.1